MALSHRAILRTATRLAQPRVPVAQADKRIQSSFRQPKTARYFLTPSTRSSFSTMAALKANSPAAAVGGGREFDREIKDMASYVHNYKIDSDLAVSLAALW